MKLGLLGKNIQHSKSKEQYESILGYPIDYKIYDCANADDIPSLDEIFSKVEGLSITAPYKTHFIDKIQLDEISQVFQVTNCIKKMGANYIGTITDYKAIEEILTRFLSKNNFKNIILLGSGSMSKLIAHFLYQKSIFFTQFSRKDNGDISSVDLSCFEKSLIINSCSRDYVFNGLLSSSSIFWDLNYNFSPHTKLANLSGVNYIDGIEMLNIQARHALKFWK